MLGRHDVFGPVRRTEEGFLVQLVIVQRGKFATFHLLAAAYADDPTVRLIWDRRVRARRETASPVPEDRRRQDRRDSPPPSWNHFQHVVVSVMDDAQKVSARYDLSMRRAPR